MDNTLLPCPFNCGGETSDLEIYKEFPDSICVWYNERRSYLEM
jgi:hypothetical protein